MLWNVRASGKKGAIARVLRTILADNAPLSYKKKNNEKDNEQKKKKMSIN
jgi:hypothetical protein